MFTRFEDAIPGLATVSTPKLPPGAPEWLELVTRLQQAVTLLEQAQLPVLTEQPMPTQTQHLGVTSRTKPFESAAELLSAAHTPFMTPSEILSTGMPQVGHTSLSDTSLSVVLPKPFGILLYRGDDNRAVVATVVSDDAIKAGIKPGDRLVRVEKQRTEDFLQAIQALKNRPSEALTEMTFVRSNPDAQTPPPAQIDTATCYQSTPSGQDRLLELTDAMREINDLLGTLDGSSAIRKEVEDAKRELEMFLEREKRHQVEQQSQLQTRTHA